MIERVVLLGGSGFVGTYIANRLARAGVRVLIPVRRRERSKDLIYLPNVEVREVDVYRVDAMAELLCGQDALINLVGILHSRDVKLPYSRDFADAHVVLPERLVAACRQAGVTRVIHMSALNAASDAPSEYLRSKGDGEAVWRSASDLAVTIMRPSVIFGLGDRFLTTFERLLSWLPTFAPLPLAAADARLQPVWVGDVADAFVAALSLPQTIGQRYDLCGPKTYALRDLVTYCGQLMGRPVSIWPLGEGLSYVQAGLLWLMPRPLMSPDNLRSMQIDNVARADSPRFADWAPRALETVAPSYIGTAPIKSRINRFRDHARR